MIVRRLHNEREVYKTEWRLLVEMIGQERVEMGGGDDRVGPMKERKKERGHITDDQGQGQRHQD